MTFVDGSQFHSCLFFSYYLDPVAKVGYSAQYVNDSAMATIFFSK